LAPKKISAKEVLIDIRAGVSSAEIGQKYGISANGTQRLFDKLLAANLLTQEKRLQLSLSPPRADPDGDNGGPISRKQEITQHQEQSLAKTQLLRRFKDDGKSPQVPSTTTDDGTVIQSNPAPESTEFLELARLGKNQWWRYVVSVLFMLIFPSVAVAIVRHLFGWNINRVAADPFLDYIDLNLSMVFLLLCLFLVVRLEHKRRLSSLIGPSQSIDWKKFGKSFGVFFGLVAFSAVIEYALNPTDFRVSFNPGRFFSFAPVVLVLTPIQTTTEELLFRGYLLQMIGLITRNRLILIVISGILFMLPHLGNPELKSGFLPVSLYYFTCGCFLTFITLKSNGLEMAMGIHAAMNLFAALIINYSNSALKTDSIFLCAELNPVFSLVSFCIGAAIFYQIMFGSSNSLRGFKSRWIGTA
jgi:membrane protease YdiL (CAAX protease family)